MPDDLKRALSVAYRLLAGRDRSVHEIRAALLKREFTEDTVEAVIRHLSEKRLLDDVKFAGLYAESLLRNKKVGPRYIEQALLKKGIHRATTENAVKAIFSDPYMQAREIGEWVERKSKQMKDTVSPQQGKKRIFDFLIRRGFSYDAIMKGIGGRNSHE